MASPRPNKRKILTLEERVKVINQSEKGLSALAISKLMGCGKTQIQSIIKDKTVILNLWQSGQGRAEQKSVKAPRLAYEKLDNLVWEWFCTARSKNLPG